MKLKRDFYIRENVVLIAQELLGKVLFTKMHGKITAGIISETEAYEGVTDRASHAYNHRRTARTEMMYAVGGTAYVYLCYGIHHLFNVVTNEKDVPHAVLIRAIKPYEGVDTILKRRNLTPRPPLLKESGWGRGICNGPGTVSQGLGIKTSHTGIDVLGKTIWVEDRKIKILKSDIIKKPRIGVDYAGTDALLPYRFMIKI
ncbi:MAG: DNA-3-methyladenine glycosylase [Bacteroidetes bacterium]|nr:DNA-3-methyladenine glycosylase [Bacteroidota bacterium]